MLQVSALSRIAMVVLLGMTIAGCEVVGGIFKAGFWIGTITVIAVLLGVVVVVAKIRG